jgi:hypothetical protein
MFNPARLWIDLLVFKLVDSHHLARVIKNHAAGTGGTLVYCGYVFSHNRFSFNIE